MFIVVTGTALRREFTTCLLDRLHSLRNSEGENDVSSSSSYYYAQDDPGHVIGLANASKQAVNKYSYDPWGVAQQEVNGVPNPFRFMGRYIDGHADLYQVRARWYDPQLVASSRRTTSAFKAASIPTRTRATTRSTSAILLDCRRNAGTRPKLWTCRAV